MNDLPPAGWHPDPGDPSQYRYWDGRMWTEHRAPKQAAQPGAAPTEQHPAVSGKPASRWVAGAVIASTAALVVDGLIDGRPDDRATGSQRPAVATPDEEFVDWIRERVPGASDRTDAEIMAGGHELCRQLDGIESRQQLAVVADALELDMQNFADTLIGAVNTICPQHRDLIEVDGG